MELKDVILSTLEELEHTKEELIPLRQENTAPLRKLQTVAEQQINTSDSSHNEALFLENIKERCHVLFEGFQSPNNSNIEAKVDLTLNFLEYLLSSIETRLKEIK